MSESQYLPRLQTICGSLPPAIHQLCSHRHRFRRGFAADECSEAIADAEREVARIFPAVPPDEVRNFLSLFVINYILQQIKSACAMFGPASDKNSDLLGPRHVAQMASFALSVFILLLFFSLNAF
jgi:hypothetical protein